MRVSMEEKDQVVSTEDVVHASEATSELELKYSKARNMALKLKDRCVKLEEELKMKQGQVDALTAVQAQILDELNSEKTILNKAKTDCAKLSVGLSEAQKKVEELEGKLHSYQEQIDLLSKTLQERDLQLLESNQKAKDAMVFAKLQEKAMSGAFYAIGTDLHKTIREHNAKQINHSWLGKQRASLS